MDGRLLGSFITLCDFSFDTNELHGCYYILWATETIDLKDPHVFRDPFEEYFLTCSRLFMNPVMSPLFNR